MEVPTSAIPQNLYPIDTPPSANLDIHANAGPRVIAVSAFLLGISGVVVSLRFVARYLSTAGIWWDDWLCLAAMLVAWGCCILGFIAPSYNFGRHEADLQLEEAVYDSMEFFKLLYAYETLYTIAITLAKASIIVFYGRIFTERTFKMALWAVSGVVAVWFVGVQITQLLECRPLHALWDGNYAESCIDLIEFFLVVGGINCAINFVLLVMPLPMIWGLEIGRKAKLGLTLTFLLGVFVLAVSIARLVITSYVKDVDVTWAYVDVALWTTAEPTIAVCSASLPILRSLWVLLRPQSSAQNSARFRAERMRRFDKQENSVDGVDETMTLKRLHNGRYVLMEERDDVEAAVRIYSASSAAPTPPPPAASASPPPPPFDAAAQPPKRYRTPPLPPVPPAPQVPVPYHTARKSSMAGLTALDMSHLRADRSDVNDIISPLSERSGKNTPVQGGGYSSRVSSNRPSRAPSMDRSKSLVSKFSPAFTTPARGNASPMTDRSDSPQTIELNRLPIQGGDYDLEDYAIPVREARRGRQQEGAREAASGRSTRAPSAARRQPSASRRSSHARGDFDAVMGSRSRASTLRTIPAVEMDARENRRFSLKRAR